MSEKMEVAITVDTEPKRPGTGRRGAQREYDMSMADVEGLSLEEVIDNLVDDFENTPVDEKSREIIRVRRFELMQQFIAHNGLERLVANRKVKSKDFGSVRGEVFERLVSHEMNDNDDSGYLSAFILDCMQHPQKLGLKKNAFKNPDRLGIVVDVQKQLAYITGMYEMKVSRVQRHGRKQIKEFYKNLTVIVAELNQKLEEMKEQYELTMLPDGGLAVKEYDDMDKSVVIPFDVKIHEEEEASLERNGWRFVRSVFSKRNVNRLAAFVISKNLQQGN